MKVYLLVHNLLLPTFSSDLSCSCASGYAFPDFDKYEIGIANKAAAAQRWAQSKKKVQSKRTLERMNPCWKRHKDMESEMGPIKEGSEIRASVETAWKNAQQDDRERARDLEPPSTTGDGELGRATVV